VTTFYLDQNVSHRFIPLLQSAGHRAITARETKLDRAGDDELVFLAWQNQWITVTHDPDDFLLLHRTLQRWAAHWNQANIHAGMLTMPDSLSLREQAFVLDVFIAAELPIINTFYEWQSVGSWVRR
jgi:hypothetical protein